MYYSKQKPTIIHYRKLKDFNSDAFIKDLKNIISQDNQIAKNSNDYFISIPITNMLTNQEYECFYSSSCFKGN